MVTSQSSEEYTLKLAVPIAGLNTKKRKSKIHSRSGIESCNMANFEDHVSKHYVPWRPNAAVVNFFQNMRQRRVPQPESKDSVRITNTPPPSTPQYAGRNHKRGAKGATTSDRLSTTARAQTNFTKGSHTGSAPIRKRKSSGATSNKPRRKRRSKKKKDVLEKRFANIKL